jgi:chromosome segregation ATPase
MASQQVITALESLHKELEKLEPAIKHVETAVEVTRIVKEIPQKHINLLAEIKSDDVRHKGELKEIFTKDLSSIADENRKLEKTTSEIQKQVKLEQDALAALKDKVQAFHDRVERINFPERLDKVDANVAGIMAAVQSIQSRLDTVERNLSEKMKEIRSEFKESHAIINSTMKQSFSDISSRQIESQKAIEEAINSSAKTQRILTYITLALIIIGGATLAYLRFQ